MLQAIKLTKYPFNHQTSEPSNLRTFRLLIVQTNFEPSLGLLNLTSCESPE
jgi:hypothetical protein